MSSATLAKVSAKTAAEVCQHFPLGDDAKKLLFRIAEGYDRLSK